MIIPHVTDLIELIEMPNDPNPVLPGTQGVVMKVSRDTGQVFVEWDTGSKLILLLGVDRFRIL